MPIEKVNGCKPVGPYNQEGLVYITAGLSWKVVMTTNLAPGAWVSSDEGVTWEGRHNTPLTSVDVGIVGTILDPKNPGRWWQAYNSAWPGYGPGGIIRTDNYGVDWQVTNAPKDVYKHFVSDARCRALVAITHLDELVVSRDAGTSWEYFPRGEVLRQRDPNQLWGELGSADSLVDIVACAFGGPDLFLQYSNGELWVIRGMATGKPMPPYPVYKLTEETYFESLAAEGRLVGLTYFGSKRGLALSRDGGQTFDPVPSSGEPELAGRISISRGTILVGSSTGGSSFISSDLGANWESIDVPGSVVQYVQWPDKSFSVAVLFSGVYHGTRLNGSDLKRIGAPGRKLFCVANSEKYLLAATESGTYYTKTPVSELDWGHGELEGHLSRWPKLLQVSPSNPGVVWRVMETLPASLTIQRSDDGGVTWVDKRPTEHYLIPQGVAVDPDDSNRVAVSWAGLKNGVTVAGLLITEDGGENWVNNEPYGTTEPVVDLFVALAFEQDRIWLGGWSGLYVTDDSGETAEKVLEDEVAAILLDGNRVIIGGKKIRYSVNGGPFEGAQTGDTPLLVRSLIKVGKSIYAGNQARWMPGEAPVPSRGVLRSTDDGKSWLEFSPGMPVFNIVCLSSSEGNLYVGTEQLGVYECALPSDS
ncbi:hypothetical protein ABZ769_36035 [Streptomyces olivoreticuli]